MNSSNQNKPPNGGSVYSRLVELLREARSDLLSQKGRVMPNLNLLAGVQDVVSKGGQIDDRKYLFENVIQIAASLPNDSMLRSGLNARFIKALWENLQHPPISYLGDEFRYRTADGSNNNITYPKLGAAGSHYARSVAPKHQGPITLPDPSIIFDSLLARKTSIREHPTKISSSLFHLATIIIHDLFHTDEAERTRLKNSSYLDLSPLYGNNMDEQKRVRTFKDGLLKKDTFSESRLLSQPPGVCALMVTFNRFHNYIVQELAIVNERGRFSLPEGITEHDAGYSEAQLKRDNDLFQTGRLITCGLYVNIILGDYLRTILNLNRNPVNSNWKLDPRDDFSDVFDSKGTPRGIGNQVSVEFNMIYRWHSATSAQDEAWTNGVFHDLFGPSTNIDAVSVDQFLQAIRRRTTDIPQDPQKWTFGDLKRTSDGSFSDDGLVKLLQAATENVAGAFGARNVPRVLKVVEMYGIQQGREWGLASLNEFREFFKLEPYSSFTPKAQQANCDAADVNPDPSIAGALEALYGHPDNIELYPGLLAEDVKKPIVPGSGLCPGFTTSFAILSDAVALVRGDRFYSVDYNPWNLTSFGFNEVSSSYDVAGGGVMYKLLMRAFPGWYRANSVYALYPFTTPEGNKETFDKLGTLQELDFNKPAFASPPAPITSWQGVVNVLENQSQFRVPWGPHTFQLTHHDYMLSGDSPANARQRDAVHECMYSPKNGLEQVRRFYEDITAKLIHQNSRKIGDSYQIDVVKDIGNFAHSAFVGRFFAIPLKSNGGGPDSYTEESLAEVLGHLFAYVFLDLDTAKSFKNRVVAAKETKRLGEAMQQVVADVKSRRFSTLRQMLGMEFAHTLLSSYGDRFVQRLLDGGRSVDDVVWTIIPTAAAASATQAQGWAQMIDLYLSDDYCSHWPAIRELALSDEPEAFEKLKKYALEGYDSRHSRAPRDAAFLTKKQNRFRLSTPAFGLIRITGVDKAEVQDGPNVVPVQSGETLFTDFITAGLDPSKFPDPYEIKLDRPNDLYIHHGWGPHACLGRSIVTVAGASMLRVCARLGNFRRAPGPAGEMKSKTVNGAFKVYLSEDGSEWGPFPTSEYNKNTFM
ncbi:fatty acid oxygenase [Trichoderma cornu-damae]|uniref:Fatty acid oxygenase n=1 Tax=Trichoderma cornu-damae TaxID=654480 RepID=A0A9P8QRP3_9HYPO|nr:fatty acid oxygenase [Trichoderma cornu-damae]